MVYKLSLFLMLGFLVGCESSRDMAPVESGKVVMVKEWPKEKNKSIVSVREGDLGTVSLKQDNPWDGYNRAFGKDLANPSKLGKENFFPESEYR
jgi:hypothetical protein